MPYFVPMGGCIYVAEGLTTQTTNGTGGTPDLITGFNTAQGVDGASWGGVVPAKASNKITLPAGVLGSRWGLTFSVSFSGTGVQFYHIAVRVDGTMAPAGEVHRAIGAGNDIGVVAITVPYYLASASALDVDMTIECDGNSKAFLPEHMTLFVWRLA